MTLRPNRLACIVSLKSYYVIVKSLNNKLILQRWVGFPFMIICILFILIFSSMADRFSMYHFHLHIAASVIRTNFFIQSRVVNTTQNRTIFFDNYILVRIVCRWVRHMRSYQAVCIIHVNAFVAFCY